MMPNLIIVGAMKAGTTSLHNYLQFQPNVSMSRIKEVNFFSSDQNWRRGTAWYESHFEAGTTIRGETSTSYTAFPMRPDVPERMHSLAPDAKLVYLVRDPVNRMISHYMHHRSEGIEQRAFSVVVEELRRGTPSVYVYQSMYHMQLLRYLKFYPQTQVLVAKSEDLKVKRDQTLAEICDFLGIQYRPAPGGSAKEWNTSREMFSYGGVRRLLYPRWLQTHPRIPWRMKAPFRLIAKLGARPIEQPRLTTDESLFLIDLFREDVRLLGELTAKNFNDWLRGSH